MSTIDVTDDTFQDTVTQDGIVFVDAWADWCGPCKQFAPTYEKASEKHTDVTFAKLDTEANQQVARGLDIRAIPTLMAFRDGILIYQNAGALPPAALDDLIQQVKDLDMDDVRRQIAEQNASEQ
ncbi:MULTISPECIES: co-chaperone YbbN [Corynebacterium]|uniref:Thioredoxin n=2 Tax=Corynebacterium TaxID=1716 RepID=A0A7W2EBK4_9CORY|nr:MULTISPECIES: thioredoxin family protein [Corynebacterium]MBA5244710.1 thioredoxin family protein [Corynebacterium haemomassiliense]MCG7236636.1 thioredoxin family protein [Corynebacterium sp. ACRQP]MCG7290565.1 thioredoxin family protein [Corynebacterium sp. ACRPZ]MCG7295021.1 thioredoxin family protein [Corynebacterium sp. ACRPY]MCZ9292772.1 thioredoxin family protein [Corynebacterium lehmanniae]